MLKYRINRRKIRGGMQPLNIAAYDKKVMPNGDEEPTEFLLTCYVDTIEGLSLGTKVMAITSIQQEIDNGFVPDIYELTQYLTVSSVDANKQMFTVTVDKTLPLAVKRIYITRTDDRKKRKVKIVFEGSHFFSNAVKVDEQTGEPITYDQKLYLQFVDKKGVFRTKELVLGVDDSDYAVVETFNIVSLNIDDMMNDSDLKELAEFIEDSKRDTGWVGGSGGFESEIAPNALSIMREQPMFAEQTSFSVYVEKAVNRIPVAFGKSNRFGLTQDLEIANVAHVHRKNSINPITDVERDVYHPVFRNKDGKFLPVYEIKFNLHFRQHRGNDWLVDNETYWNGVKRVTGEKGEEIKPIGKYFATPDGQEGYQSDLISYLNFTNGDVKFQKSRLKKTLLRLGFYDSDNVTEQMMVGNSTIFMDAGKLFTKQIRHMKTEDYIRIDEKDGAYEVTDKLVGCKVDRETTYKSGENISDTEDRRLSSQFSVKDYNNSQASSEGFYLYMMRSMRTGTKPEELYLKVEFNHAGYGFTLPMMMPYWDGKKWDSRTGIKSFGEILKDWKDKERKETDGPYGVRQYLKYAHIKLKYQYDPLSQRYVYYLDNGVYGDNMANGSNGCMTYNKVTGCLTLNLYEAKIMGPDDEPEKDTKTTTQA